MRWTCLATPLIAALAMVVIVVPAAGASQPGDTEHGVNRAKLAAKAMQTVETRNAIDVQRISRCGPQKKGKRLNYSTWICEWRAEGVYPGEVPYACAGRAVWKRKGNRWRVDRCENRLQPQAPLLATPNAPPTFGFNEDWIFQSLPAFDLLAQTGAQVARTSIPWARRRADQGSVQLVRLRRPVPAAAGARDQAALGPDRGAVLRAGEPGRLRRGPQRAAPVAGSLRRVRPVRGLGRQALSATRPGSRSGTSPTTRGIGAGRRSRATTPRC